MNFLVSFSELASILSSISSLSVNVEDSGSAKFVRESSSSKCILFFLGALIERPV